MSAAIATAIMIVLLGTTFELFGAAFLAFLIISADAGGVGVDIAWGALALGAALLTGWLTFTEGGGSIAVAVAAALVQLSVSGLILWALERYDRKVGKLAQ